MRNVANTRDNTNDKRRQLYFAGVPPKCAFPDSSEFGHDGLGVIDQRFVVVERDDAHLIRREPEREVARVMLDEEADEPLMRAGQCLLRAVQEGLDSIRVACSSSKSRICSIIAANLIPVAVRRYSTRSTLPGNSRRRIKP